MFTSTLESLLNKQTLSAEHVARCLEDMIQGTWNHAQIAAFLVAMRMKGETVDELTAAVSYLAQLANRVNIPEAAHLIDIVGTGGDQHHSFNISTTSAFVVAAAGGTVAKHGSRAVSSASGAADVLEQAGVNIQLNASEVHQCITKLGVGFMFAPKHHTALKHVAEVRKSLGVRTLFNLLGPLLNPAAATYHLIGVFHQQWLLPFAQTLKNLGSKKALIVHGADGLDEISIASKTHVAELNQGRISTYTIEPEEFGLQKQDLASLRIDNAEQGFIKLRQVLQNKPGAALDIVCLNAGAALYAGDICPTISEGVAKAQEMIADGRAYDKLQQLIALTQTMKN